MNEHLNEERLNALLLNEADEASSAHLAACESCRNELQQMSASLAGLRAESTSAAERPQDFWRAQRRAIAARLAAVQELPTRPLAWATSLAGILLFAALLSRGLPVLDSSPQQALQTEAAQAAADPDHDLLVDIGRSVRRDVPRALEPASLIAQELHRAATKSDR